jgi:hypothetical protein
MYAGDPVPAEQRAYLHIVGKKPGYNNVFIISLVDNERTITFFERMYYPFAGARMLARMLKREALPTYPR